MKKYLTAFLIFVAVFCSPAILIKVAYAYGEVGHELGKFVYEVVND